MLEPYFGREEKEEGRKGKIMLLEKKQKRKNEYNKGEVKECKRGKATKEQGTIM